MEAWIIFFFFTISIAISLKLLLSKLTSSSRNTPSLPPGPPAIPFFIKNAIQRISLFELEHVLLKFHAKYGPIICLRVPYHPIVFIADRNLTHEALVQRGLILSDRPSLVGGPRKIVTGYPEINNTSYGPLWRVLRRNLTSEILLPQRIKIFGPGRKWALGLLLDSLRLQSETGDRVVAVMDSFQFPMFSLLVLMCFGEKVNEKEILEIQELQCYFLRLIVKFNPFGFLPKIAKHLFKKKWDEIVEALKRQEEIFVRLIKLRREQRLGSRKGEFAYSYVDSLLDVELEGGEKLRDGEIASLCHEFVAGGTDTTSAELEWIVAELVKHQEVQEKLREEVDEVDEIEVEEELEGMPYLKAVIMEGLRRHPPGHYLLPHKATEDVIVGGYLVPKGAQVNVHMAEPGWDGTVWEDPMEFRPERFLGKEVDITGSREIKMMPFGVGRRMCPAFRLAILHLEYFVANLVREFEWNAVEGEEVDLSEKFQFTTVMKNPLRARICPRRK